MKPLFSQIKEQGLFKKEAPDVFNSINYECRMGSWAYGLSNDDSDLDIYGFGTPFRSYVFPHWYGEIEGFGTKLPRFHNFQEHHIPFDGKSVDLTIYSIVRFFDLCLQNNPNMIDSLFVPDKAITFIDPIGQLVRDNRQRFLHKGCWHKFKGYAYSQLHKMQIKTPDPGSKREANFKKYGFDTKFAYHVVRLMLEVEEILEHGTLTLDKNVKILQDIRQGLVSEQEIHELFALKERELEKLYQDSKLPYGSTDIEEEIKTLLLKCLTMAYGD